MKILVMMLMLAAAAQAGEYRRFELAGFEHISLEGTVHAIERQLTPDFIGGRVVERNSTAPYFRTRDVLYIRSDVWRDMVERSTRRISYSRLRGCRWYSACGELK